ncbi:MAG: hypothetical protein IJI46_10335 [Erysipelotrichaceae bacterium]|nr:hypothetical protein [Erysipelotrichaceae bacterium]
MRLTHLIVILCIFLLCACSTSGNEGGSASGTSSSSMKMQDLQGTVNVNDGEKDIESFAGMNLYSGYGIVIEKESYDWTLLKELRLMKMDENSKTSIEQDGKKIKIMLEF